MTDDQRRKINRAIWMSRWDAVWEQRWVIAIGGLILAACVLLVFDPPGAFVEARLTIANSRVEPTADGAREVWVLTRPDGAAILSAPPPGIAYEQGAVICGEISTSAIIGRVTLRTGSLKPCE